MAEIPACQKRQSLPYGTLPRLGNRFFDSLTFYQMAAEKGEQEAEKQYQKMKTEILQREVPVSEIDMIIQYLYEDRATGRITAERYETLSAKYETEQKNLKNDLSDLKLTVDDTEMKERFIQDFLDKAKSIQTSQQLRLRFCTSSCGGFTSTKSSRSIPEQKEI